MADNRKWLYDALTGRGANLGTYEQYEAALSEKSNLDWLYDAAQKTRINVGTREQLYAALAPQEQPAADPLEDYRKDAEAQKAAIDKFDADNAAFFREHEHRAKMLADYGGDLPVEQEAALHDAVNESLPVYESRKALRAQMQKDYDSSPYVRLQRLDPDGTAYGDMRRAERDIETYSEQLRAAGDDDEKKRVKGLLKAAREDYYRNPIVIGTNEENARSAEGANARVEEHMRELRESHKGDGARKPGFAEQFAKAMSGVAGDSMAPQIAENYAGENEDRALAAAAESLNEDTAKIYRSPSKWGEESGWSNFWRGAAETASDIDFWTMGLSGMQDAMSLNGVFDKIRAKLGTEDLTEEKIDAALTPLEKDLYEAFCRNAMAQAERAEDMSKGYQAGASAADSLMFMAQFALTGGATEGTVKAMGKWLGKRLGVQALGKVGGLAAKGAGKVAQSAAMTLIQPTTYQGVLERVNRMEQSSPGDPSSPMRFADESGAVLKGLGDAWVENFSEMVGGPIDKVLSLPFKGAGKLSRRMFGNTKFLDLAEAFYNSSAVEALKKGGWNNYAGEVGEELVGAAMRQTLGIDDQALSQFFDKDNMDIMLLSFLPTMGMGGVVNTARAGVAIRDYDKADTKYREASERLGIQPGSMENLKDAKTVGDVSAALTESIRAMMESGERVKAEDVMSAVDLAKAAVRRRFYEDAGKLQVNGRRERDFAGLGEKYGTFWSDGGDGGRTVTRVMWDGKPGFATAADETGLMSVTFDDGTKAMLRDGDLDISGGAPVKEVMPLDAFLDKVDESRRRKSEGERVQMESNANLLKAQERLQPQTVVNIGTLDSKVAGTVQQWTPDGVVIVTEDGMSREYPWEEAQRLPLYEEDTAPEVPQVKTDAQAEEEAVEALESADERKRHYNLWRTHDVTFRDGEKDVSGTLMMARTDDDTASVKMQLRLGDGTEQEIDESQIVSVDGKTPGQVQEYGREYEDVWGREDEKAVPVWDGNAGEGDSGIGGPSSDAAEQSTGAAQERESASEPNLPLKADGSVDQKALWNSGPEAWAKWNDAARGDGGANSEAYLGAVLKQVEGEGKALAKAYAKETDFDKRDELEGRMLANAERSQKIGALLKGYADARAAAEEERKEQERKEKITARLEKERAALEANTPQTIEALAASMFSREDMRGKLDRDDFKRELGWGDAELRKFWPWWAKKGKGRSLISIAEAMPEFDDRGLIPVLGDAEQKDTQAARNAIISVFQQALSPKDVMSFTRRQNEETMERMRQEERDYVDGYFMQNYGMTVDEYMASERAKDELEGTENQMPAHLAEHLDGVPDLLPTQDNDGFGTKQGNSEEQAPDAVSGDAGSRAEEIKQVRAIEEQRKVVDTEPTEAQKEAGNYRMGHVRIDGLDITIENPRGSIRKGTDAGGHEWQTEMHNDYGYIRGTKAVDDDHIDMFLSDSPTRGKVYVIDQVDPKTGEFDESKVMYGFDSEQDAREAYLSNYEDGWQGLGKITEVSKEEFKKWIDSSTRKTKPFSEYASVKAAEAKKENTTDNQGDPVNEDGTLKIDKIKSIDDLTDSDFSKPYRNVALPDLPENVNSAIVAEGKPVIIKKSIFEKVSKAHSFDADESRKILKDALYNPDIVGQSQPKSKKNNWIAIKIDDSSPIVVLEVNRNKDNVEIVGWYTLDNRNLERIRRQAEREDGELLILTPKGAAASLSTLPSDLSSADKSTQSSGAKQEDGGLSDFATEIYDDTLSGLPEGMKGRVTVRESSTGDEAEANFVQSYDIDGKPSGISRVELFSAELDDNPTRFIIDGSDVDAPMQEQERWQRLADEYRSQYPKANFYVADEIGICFMTFDDALKFLSWAAAEESSRNSLPSEENRPQFQTRPDDRKERQLEIINATNPMLDDYHTGIRKVGDIKTLSEAVEEAKVENGEDELSAYPDVPNGVFEEALKSGEITVYSSKPIRNGVFVTPSHMQAFDYAGYGKVYEKKVPIEDVAWINTDEGQYARVEDAGTEGAAGKYDAGQKDKEYFAALERGDMDTAQRIVNEAAEMAGYAAGSGYQGTSAFNGAAPWGNGYFLTKEERKEAWDNDEFDGDQTLGDYIERGIDSMNLDFIALDPRNYRTADTERKEAIDNVRNAIQKKSKTITMYRSVPADVKEGSFRNGDWVTPSRAYAVENARIHGWGDNYNIIEQEVPVDEIWWDGNDIAEWGYGRESDYINDTDFTYKNTENNRKLLDVVTRDDNGEIIPPSKRFNASKQDERYQIAVKKKTDANSEASGLAFDAVSQMLSDAGIPVERMSDEAMRELAENANALETASVQNGHQPTVVSSASGAKVIKEIDNLIKELQNVSNYPKTILGNIAKALGAKKHGSNSQYATFEAKNGVIVTIRLANHNAATSTFDNHGEDNGISIVISARDNTGMNNDGRAHVTEYYYDAIRLRKAEGKPLAEIVKSIKQSLYSGEYKDTTGLAQVEEVNPENVPELMTGGRTPKQRWVDNYVNAVHLATGQDKKTIREGLAKKLEEARREAKELYADVLSGNFNDVTLQRIDNYIDNATDRNRFYRPLSQRLPERAVSAVSEGGRTGAVDALFSRICESTVPANERTRAEGRRKIEARKEECLEGWAKATGNWHESVADFTANTTPVDNGTDSDVYLSDDGGSVIKVSKGKFDNRKFPSDIDQVTLFNFVFPQSAYRILGYGRVDGKFVRFLEQPFVDFSESQPLTTEERVDYMGRLGFEPRNKEKTVFSNEEIVVSDLQKGNIVRSADGNIRVIDADVKLHTKDIGGTYTYPPVEADTEVPELMTVYHGSGAEFDRFDHSHMGEGEGAQAYGWGTYVTEIKGIGKSYAKKLGTRRVVYDGFEPYSSDIHNAENVINSQLYNGDFAAAKAGEMAAWAHSKVNPMYVQVLMRSTESDWKAIGGQRYLYTVEVPEDNGSNYLDWEKRINETESDILTEIDNKLYNEEGWSRVESSGLTRFTKGKETIVLNPTATGADLYEELSVGLGSPKTASEFLNSLGYVGISYPAEYMSGGRPDEARNYVIFNEADVKIVDRIEFLKSGDTVYGAAVGGKILLNAEKLNPNTPMHEYTHLWDRACRTSNPELWRRGVELMKQTSVWKEVENDPNYSGLDEDGIASEVHSRLSGDNGEAVLTRMSQEIINEGGSQIDMAAKFSVISRLKKWLSDFWHWVKDTMTPWSREEAEKVSLEDFVNMPLSDLAKGTRISVDETGGASYSIVTDANEIDRLDSEPKIKAYRAMQLVDGKLYPPMSGKVNGKWRDGIAVEDLGKVWEKADENPELADGRGLFTLNKGNGTSLKARYNPYIHTSTTPLNDQFSSAQSRPELVTVEVEIPESELTSGYRAEKAKDSVGKVEWKAGAVQGKLSGTRTVILSRWDKPVRIVPDSEVADKIVEMFDGRDITMPSNVVTPSLRAELERRGVSFVETDNQGRRVEGDGIRYRQGAFISGLESEDEVYDAFDELMETRHPLQLQSALEDYYGGAIRSASWGAKNAMQNEGLLPFPGDKYSGAEGEYHHIMFEGEDGNTFVKDVPFDTVENVEARLPEKTEVSTARFRNGATSFTPGEIARMETPILESKGTFQDLNEAEKWAKEHLQGESYTNTFTGEDVYIGSKSLSEVFDKKFVKAISPDLHKAAVMSIPDFIRSGIPAEVHPDTHGRGFDVVRLYSAILIDDNIYRVKSTVRRVQQGDRYYSYELQEMELAERRPLAGEGEEMNSHNPNDSESSITSKNTDGTQSPVVGVDGTDISRSQTRAISGEELLRGVKKTNSDEEILWNRFASDSEPFSTAQSDAPSAANIVKDFENPTPSDADRRRREATESARYNASDYRRSVSSRRLAAEKTANGLGVKVRYVSRAEMPENGRHAAGYWKDGQIYVCLENNIDAEDAVKTVLHEAVGHNGLRRLVGSGNMTAFCHEMFGKLPKVEREAIARDAVRNGGNLSEAVEEHLARIAETLNPDKSYERNLWDIIRDGVRRMLAKIGIDIPLSQRDLRWLLWQSAQANRLRDPLVQARRQAMANRLGFSRMAREISGEAEDAMRFRKADEAFDADAASLYNHQVMTARERLKEVWVDQFASVETLVDAIEEKSGKKARGFEDVRLALNQQSSKGLAAMQKWEREHWNPIGESVKKIIADTGMRLEDIERYVMLKHGLERNEVFAKRDARKHYQAMHDSEVDKIRSGGWAKDVKDAAIARADAALELRLSQIEAGTDSEYLKNRETDYGGLTGMYSEFDEIAPFDPVMETEEQFLARQKRARHPKYDNVGEMERAATAEVADFETKAGESVDMLWKAVNAATKATLRHQYESNMLSRKQYEDVKGMFRYYVPLRGFKDAEASDIYDYYQSDQRNGFSAPLVHAKGRTTEAESPFGNIGAMASSAIAQDAKNDAKLAFYYFVSNRPDNGLVTISDVWYEKQYDADGNPVTDEAGRAVFKPAYPEFRDDLSAESSKEEFRKFEHEMEDKAKRGDAFKGERKLSLDYVVHIDPAQEKAHVVRVKVGGKEKMMLINGNPRASQAINGEFNMERSDGFKNALQIWLRYISGMNTSYNPEFWISNFQRDVLFSLMSASVKEDPEYFRLFRKNLVEARKVVAMNRALQDGTLGDSATEKAYREFVDNGGVTGYTVLKKAEEWDLALKKLTGDELAAVNGVKTAFEAVQQFGESIEQMTRFAAFLTSRQQGKGIRESVSDAKELTVNFNRKGSGQAVTWKETARLRTDSGRPLNDVQRALVMGASWLSAYGRLCIMFFNAAVQGVNALYRLFRKDAKRMMMWASGYAAIGAMYAALHAMLDDDDDYLDIPDYERRNNLLIGGKGVYFKWALPQEARVFYALGDVAVNRILGREPHKAGVKGFATEIGSMIGDVLPMNFMEGERGFVPSFTIPIVESLINKDYKGSKIYNDMRYLSDEERKRTPAYQKAYRDTGKVLIDVSTALNGLTGGDYADAGWVNLNPAVIEHLIEGYTGGAGTTVEKIFKSTVGRAVGGEFSVRSTPFLSRLLTINDERYRNAHTTDLFNYYKAEAEHTRKRLRTYSRNGDDKRLDALYDSKDYEIMLIYRQYKGLMEYYADQLKLTDDKAERKRLMREQDEYRKQMIREISEIR